LLSISRSRRKSHQRSLTWQKSVRLCVLSLAS
jgi:hypothetical protein